MWRGRQAAKKSFKNNGEGSIYALKFSTLPEEFNANGPAFGSPLASVDSYVSEKVVLTCSRFATRLWRRLCI